MQDFQIRSRVHVGDTVQVAVKNGNDYSPDLHTGIVAEILTNTSEHYRGIKVRLTDGTVGRTKVLL